jgi:hypothetical protein
MSFLKGVSRNHKRIKRGLFVMALGCFLSANGFGQLVYLTDTRSISGYAKVNNVSQYNSPPYYTTYYSGDFSGSAMPYSPFADFMGNVNGTATFQGGMTNSGGGQTPITITSTVMASQTSFLHSGELYFNASESSSGSPGTFGQPSSQWSAEGSASLQVSFEVLIPIPFNLMLQGTGDPFASSDDFSLSSSSQGVLFSGDTTSMLQRNQYGTPFDFSGTFTPGNIYTLTLDSQGQLDGGGLAADLTVPEPSMTALAGLAFVIFLLRVRQINRRAVPVRIPRDRVGPPRSNYGAPRGRGSRG